MPSPQLKLLSEADLAFVHERSLEVLARVGVVFESEQAQALLRDAGCRVEGESGRVLFPPEVVEAAVRLLRRDVLLAAREPARDALLDGSSVYSTMAGISPYVVDFESGEPRIPSLEDLSMAGRLADALDEVDIVWYPLSPTADVAPEVVDLAGLACLLASTSKHIEGEVLTPEELPFVLELLHAANGGQSLRERPIFSAIYCPVAPLQHEKKPLEAAMGMAREWIPIDIFSLALSGATAPATLAGTITQTNCDVLSAVVLFKLVNPDCPLIYSANAGIMDMRTSRFSTATPETMLMNLAQVELAHSYNMPALSVGYSTDAGELSFRGGLEDMGLSLQTRLSRPDVLIGMGCVDSGQALDYRKLVLDAEVRSHLDRVMNGISVDGDHIDVDLMAKVGPGGHYLKEKQTTRTIRGGEHWLPHLLHRTPFREVLTGAASELERAGTRVNELLSAHEPMPLPPGAGPAFDSVLARAGMALGAEVGVGTPSVAENPSS